MLKQPDTFLPVTTDAGFQTLVSSGRNGDFRVKDLATGELYLNFFAMGQSFFRVSKWDGLSTRTGLEQVVDKELVTKLIGAKYSYVNLYFEQ